MKLIVIRGKEHEGKTTTTALVHNEILLGLNGRVLEITPSTYEQNIIPVPIGEDTPNFSSVIQLNGFIIGIISYGDNANELRDKINSYFGEFPISIMIVCARKNYCPGSAIKMLTECFFPFSESVFQIWTKRDVNPQNKISSKEEVVRNIINKVKEYCGIK